MSRRSLVLALTLLPLTTIGAVIYSLPMQRQYTPPQHDRAMPQGERLESEPHRSAVGADAAPPMQPNSSRKPQGSEKDSPDRDSTRSVPARPDAREVTGAPMLASAAPAPANRSSLSTVAVTRSC